MILLLTIIMITRELWALINFNTYYHIIQKGVIDEIAISIQDKLNLKNNTDKIINITTYIKNFISYLILSCIDILYLILCIIFIIKEQPYKYIATLILILSSISLTRIRSNRIFEFIDSLICLILLLYSFLLQTGLVKWVY